MGRDPHTQRGMALILAVLAVFLLSVAVIQTRAGVNMAEEIAVSAARETQALYMARSGLALVREALAEDDAQVDSYEDDWAAANDLGAVPIADVGWVVGRVWDEEGKFNVLDLVNEEGEVDADADQAALRLMDLLTYLGLPEDRAGEIVDSLVDWMDDDSTVTGAGAEDPYYRSLMPPYSCPKAPPSALDELALVKGVGSLLLSAGEGEVPPLSDYLTVHGSRKPGDRFRRVNLNTAPVEVLMALHPDVDRRLAEEIVASRAEEPFKNPAEIKDIPGGPSEEFYSNELAHLVDVSSSHFSARITGETPSASSRAYGVFSRQGEVVSLVYYKGF
ncbi:MAG: type II secretion system minor pseudopilin GspK [bacterium]|nr:MAG: type II secretion system minor pseudopilin GspK [bacterium]